MHSLKKTRNDWITQGFKTSCQHKRSLYIHSRSNKPHMRAYYNKYCKILTRVIKEAKRQHYRRLIEKSDNKIKTTWNIIKHESGKLYPMEQISSVLINKDKVNDSQKIADASNTFFLIENLGLHQEAGGDAIAFLKNAFPRKFPGLRSSQLPKLR
jgi:hypothetical protein